MALRDPETKSPRGENVVERNSFRSVPFDFHARVWIWRSNGMNSVLRHTIPGCLRFTQVHLEGGPPWMPWLPGCKPTPHPSPLPTGEGASTESWPGCASRPNWCCNVSVWTASGITRV